MVITRINKSELPDHFLCDAVVFLGRSSFESRSFSACSELASCNFLRKHFFISKEESEKSKLLRKKQGFPDETYSTLDTSNPLQTHEEICSEISAISKIPGPFSFIVDSTTFRKEELLILLKEISKLSEDIRANTSFVYSVAKGMGKWLSNNVKQIRPVIGYPGDIRSRESTHLVLLLGVEHHRAMATIDAYEPSYISLGMVPRNESISDEIHQRNLELRDYIVRHYDNITSVFEFGAKNSDSVQNALQKILCEYSTHNIIIAPLNTKLSTLGCGAFAISNPKVQLCYAEVEVYNAGDYSVSSDEVLVVQYSDLF